MTSRLSKSWRIAFAAILTLCLPTAVRAGLLYGTTGTGGNPSTLYTIDPTTGVATSIAPITIGGTQVVVTAIAFNPLDAKLYGTALDPVSPNNGELFTLDVHGATPGAATVVGAFGVSPASTTPTSLAFSSSGTLYAYFKNTLSPNNESLFSINTATGAAAAIGKSNISTSGNGMAMSSSGTLYFTPAGASGKIYTLNTTTGAATAGATLNGAPNPTGQIKGLAFDSLGTLFGLDFMNSSPFASQLVTIDPLSGLVSNVGATTNGMTSLAFEPAAVPEPGSLGLVAAAVLGYFVRRKIAARRSEAGN